ncbi:hypothetical protein Q5M85_03155 [Paraclostridium bifermentans]|nr:hypothetical protein [Paraclostridium bifermentans]
MKDIRYYNEVRQYLTSAGELIIPKVVVYNSQLRIILDLYM